MTKRFTSSPALILAVVFCLSSINATAATSNTLVSPSVNIAMAIIAILLAVTIIGITASKKLKKVGKQLEDTFGEKVLP